LDLANHVVAVTGSTSGIGEAVARRLAACGAAVVVNSARSVAAGHNLAEQLPDALYVGGDIADPDTARALVRAATDRWGRLDGLVNNAAMTTGVPLHDIDALTLSDWERVLSVNVIGTFLVSQAALPLLRESDDGWIINVTSIAGVRQTGSSLPYAVSKAAVNHLTTLMAKFAGGRVRVNAVAPGMVDTPWTEGWDAQRELVAAAAPLHRTATPDDVADACIGIVGSRYLTGQTIVVDGGLSLMI
jgi:ketoreductase RED2